MRHLKNLEYLSVQVVEKSPYLERPERFDSLLDSLQECLRGVKGFDLKSLHIAMFVNGTLTEFALEKLEERLERTEKSLRRSGARASKTD